MVDYSHHWLAFCAIDMLSNAVPHQKFNSSVKDQCKHVHCIARQQEEPPRLAVSGVKTEPQWPRLIGSCLDLASPARI